MSLRKLVHCAALCLAVTFAGLAVLYLQLDAQFVGFAQAARVCVGAVAIFVVSRDSCSPRGGEPAPHPVVSRSWIAGVAIAVVVFGVLAKAISSSAILRSELPAKPSPTVQQIGNQLMTYYVLPLEVVGLLLTAATIGAVIIAMQDDSKRKGPAPLKMKASPATTTSAHGSPDAHH